MPGSRRPELVGDHYLVPRHSDATSVATLDKHRLYVKDRAGRLHLLSPLVLWHECDDCTSPRRFVLDSYARKARTCRTRAMDHNHAITVWDVVDPFVTLGLLPAD